MLRGRWVEAQRCLKCRPQPEGPQAAFFSEGNTLTLMRVLMPLMPLNFVKNTATLTMESEHDSDDR
jgi:hypothetical protein